MLRYPPICGKYTGKKDIAKRKITKRKKTRKANIDNEKDLRQTMEEKERIEEMRENHRKVKEMVPKQFHWWFKVFRKVESERMLIRKPWDHIIDLKPDFISRKGRIYPLFHTEKEEVQVFVESQLKKGYIQPSKSPQTSPVLFVPKKDGKRRMVQDY